MRFDFRRDDFEVGQMVAYFNGGDDHVGPIEVGVVKSLRDDGAFVAYSVGDTCAKTPYRFLIPIGNSYAVEGLVQRMEQLGYKTWPLSEGCEVWHG